VKLGRHVRFIRAHVEAAILEREQSAAPLKSATRPNTDWSGEQLPPLFGELGIGQCPRGARRA
jgi:hypothetical protein